MSISRTPGLVVTIRSGAPEREVKGAVEVDVGSDLPVAFSGLRKLLVALQAGESHIVSGWRALHAPEWNVVFPDEPTPGRSLFELADAPNQRRLFRESEQTFRVLNVAAHVLVDGIRELQRPLVLRNVGACDLVSLRGLMHAVQCSRLSDVRESLVLCDWRTSARYAAHLFADTRVEHLRRAVVRMRGVIEPGDRTGPMESAVHDPTLEGRYLRGVVDAGSSAEHRLGAALLAIRACFFSTNYEGAMLAAETGLAILDAAHGKIDESALRSAWDELDDAHFDIPMLELDRSSLGDWDQLRALLLLHIGVIRVFTGRSQQGLEAFGQALECRITPELTSDLRMYRGLVTSKMLGNVGAARAEIDAGLIVLDGRPRAIAATHAAWLHNLMALTYFQERNLDEAQRAEERSLSCIDNAPGPSAAHLKTNLISNFSVLYEARGDIPMATTIWQAFAGLNEKLGSDAADKVYLNRLGALQREGGDTRAAIESYRGAFLKAEATGDIFHAETIASAIARVYLDRGSAGDREQAASWYRTAGDRARVCGDWVQLAKDLAGVAIATNAGGFSEAREVLACDTAYEREALSLSGALSTDDPQAVLRELPRSKSKLSRPFTLVNL